METEFFRIDTRDDLRLITPLATAAVANAGWSPANRWNRSRIETVDGRTVSQGFGKFFNLGQGPDELRVESTDVLRACAEGDAVATLKVDGSLLIRSVHRGVVNLRTRGMWDHTGLDNADEVELFRREHPVLFDPNFEPNRSLLMEWVSPRNTIVLRYDRPALTLLGAVEHEVPRYVTLAELAGVAARAGVALVEHFRLDAAGWEAMLDRLRTERTIEGYVIRLRGEQDMVKVKAEPYLTRHALKTSLTSAKLGEMWLGMGSPQPDEFVRAFATEFDEETCLWAAPALSALFEGVRKWLAIQVETAEFVESRRAWLRKDFALAAQEKWGTGKTFSWAMSLWLGRSPKPELALDLLQSQTPDVRMRMFKSADDEG